MIKVRSKQPYVDEMRLYGGISAEARLRDDLREAINFAAQTANDCQKESTIAYLHYLQTLYRYGAENDDRVILAKERVDKCYKRMLECVQRVTSLDPVGGGRNAKSDPQA